MEAILLIRVDFDYLENWSPKYQKEVGIFIDDKLRTKEEKVKQYLKNIKKNEYYKGYDGNTYPKFIQKRKTIL